MATLITKYSIGDVVYFAGTVTERKRHPCPDCKGSREWTAASPAGGEYTMPCPRCTSSYISDRDLSLDYSALVPAVCRLTIGSVQFNTAAGAYDEGARYMCVETGVGGGSVYNEDRLFESENEATRAAQALADSQNATTEWIVKQYDKSLSVSDYQIENASMKLAKEAGRRAQSMLWNLNGLFSQIENDCDDKDAILEAIEDYRKYSWENDKAEAEAA